MNILDKQSQERVASYRSGTWIGQAIRARRLTLGLSLRDVADRVEAATTALGDRPNIGAAGLSRVENGYRYPSLRTLEALAGALEMTFTITPDDTTTMWLEPRQEAA
jgi:transcriptional regulator with XRE-family HTH domain